MRHIEDEDEIAQKAFDLEIAKKYGVDKAISKPLDMEIARKVGVGARNIGFSSIAEIDTVVERGSDIDIDRRVTHRPKTTRRVKK